jgi:hypothetical protein
MTWVRRGCLLLIGLLTGCGPHPAPEAEAESPLLTSVRATTFGRDSVHFTLQVTNTSDQPIELTYPSGQSFEFVVVPAQGGGELWRWSSDMMFTQALRTERLDPGETRTHTVPWSPPGEARGEFEVRASLTAMDVRAERAARFRLE